MRKIHCILLILLFSFTNIQAQEENKKPEEFHPYHSLGLIISHTHIGEGKKETDSKTTWLMAPSVGLNYNYKFSKKWAIGLHTDIVIDEYEVKESLKSENVGTIKRSYPIASAVMASYKPGKHFSFMLGAGGEFAKEEDLFLFRAGAEYGYEINEEWEFNANITNDFKIDAYNSFAYGIGITRIF